MTINDTSFWERRHHNQLSGELPKDLELPEQMGQMSLHYNAFTGGK